MYLSFQNPDIVLVHYLNVPYPDDNKLAVITPSLALWADKKEWTKDELVSQLKPMFFSEDEPDLNNELEISVRHTHFPCRIALNFQQNFKLQTAETVEAIVSQLMEKQRVARQAALVKQLECGCPDSTCADGKSCSHPMRRITAAKGDVSPLPSSSSNSRPPSSADNNNQVSSTTGSGSMLLPNGHSPRVYSRDSRNHHHHQGRQCSSSSSSGNTPPLVLSLSQIQGGGGLLILNSNSSSNASPNNQSSNHHQSLVSPVSVAGFVCHQRKSEKNNGHMILKQEAMDTNQSPSSPHKMHQQRKMEIGENLRQSSMFENVGYSTNHNHQTEVVMSSAPSTPSKHMDTTTNHEDDFKHQNFCTETVVVLDPNSHGNLVKSNNGSINAFFNETLDLSQEDIQRTLSANMPLCSGEMDDARRPRHHTDDDSVAAECATRNANKPSSVATVHQQMNPMDFINNCDVVVSPTHVVDDDVFVNLDAFDMLGEFPDLEVLDSGHAGLLDVNPSEGVRNGKEQQVEQQQQQQQQQVNEGATAKITDYSPEWAYPEGGVKVLVTGPWHSAGPYTVLFDTFPVPTTLVQSGVLRCYCPGKSMHLRCCYF